jgi:hypothetical protein
VNFVRLRYRVDQTPKVPKGFAKDLPHKCLHEFSQYNISRFNPRGVVLWSPPPLWAQKNIIALRYYVTMIRIWLITSCIFALR